jgi:hypothetical protein
MKKSAFPAPQSVPRRDFLKFSSVAGVLGMVPLSSSLLLRFPIHVANREVELQIVGITAHTVRLTLIAPPDTGDATGIASDGSLVRESWTGKATRLSGLAAPDMIASGDLRIHVTLEPLTVAIKTVDGALVQTLQIDKETGVVTFTRRRSDFRPGRGGRAIRPPRQRR